MSLATSAVPLTHDTARFGAVPTPLEQRPILSACLHRLKMQFPGLRPINVVDYDQVGICPPCMPSLAARSAQQVHVITHVHVCQADMVQSAYHLSLSRTVSVRYNQILPLVHSLRERLKACQR